MKLNITLIPSSYLGGVHKRNLKGRMVATDAKNAGDLTRNQFLVLQSLIQEPPASRHSIAEHAGLSVEAVSVAVRQLIERGALEKGVSEDLQVTGQGIAALEPYRVDNAVILAAGLSTRFAPISYEKPKGLLHARGEILIERQIRQLKEAGIDDITVVVGYKKEYFFYLEELFGVSIVVNDRYAERNNHSSLMVVLDRLRRTYVCSSDNYFVENPFESHVFEAYYATQYVQDATDEWCVCLDTENRIVGVTTSGADAQAMLGHVFFDEPFSRHMAQIIRDEWDLSATKDKLWEALFADHVDEFHMVARPYPADMIYEFDTLDDLREFDPAFLENVDSRAFDNIVTVLGCKKTDICDVYPLKQGLTNLSCHVRVGESEYVYRHPGVGTENLVDRHAELAGLDIARELGLDNTFIAGDPKTGWKLSRFIADSRPLDPHDGEQTRRAMHMARTLHESKATLEREFDFYAESIRYERLLRDRRGIIDVPGYDEMAARMRRLRGFVDGDDSYTCLCHNDFFSLNFLIGADDEISLIDWEYAGMSDYASDFGTYTVCCELSVEEAEEALAYYFGRPPTFEELRHNFAYVAFAGWCWYVWSLMKEAEGDIVGEWLHVYYRYAKRYLDMVLPWYEQGKRL